MLLYLTEVLLFYLFRFLWLFSIFATDLQKYVPDFYAASKRNLLRGTLGQALHFSLFLIFLFIVLAPFS